MPTTQEDIARDGLGMAKLLFRSGPSRGKVLVVEQDRLTLGRDPSNDVCIEDEIVSSRHAVIGRRTEPPSRGGEERVSYWIEDLGSKNGTFVNGKRVDRAILSEGDVICLCQTGQEIQFTHQQPKLPSLIATSTQTFSRTRSIESAIRELLPASSKTSKGSVSATGVRQILGETLEESSRRSRRAVFIVGLTLCVVLIGGFVSLAVALRGRGESYASVEPAAGPAVDVAIDIQVDSIYSSLFHSYRDDGLGEVVILHRGPGPLEGTRLSFEIAERETSFLTEEIIVAVPALEEGASWRYRVTPKFTADIITSRPKELTAVVELRRGDRVIQRASKAVTLHDYHAFNWEKPERVAVFIDSADAAVGAFVDAAWKHRPDLSHREFPPSNMVGAITLLTALADRGLRYKPDAQTPVSVDTNWRAQDRVNYPGETLLKGTGDCDDLVVLACSVLEAVGIPTAVAVGHDHVLLLFDSGLRAVGNAPTDDGTNPVALLHPESYVELDGRLWLPVETTELARRGATFASAWSAAWHRREAIRSGSMVVVTVRKAWESYKSLSPDPDVDVLRMIRDPAAWQQPGLTRKVEDAIEAVKRAAREQVDERLRDLRGSLEGAELAQEIAWTYATSGLYDEAVHELEAAIFGTERPSSVAALRAWSDRVTEELAILLNDLASVASLAAHEPEDYARAAEYYRLALGGLPADLPEVGEIMLRLGFVERLRGDLFSANRWIDRALREHPGLEETYRLLQRGSGAVADPRGPSSGVRELFLSGLRARRVGAR